MRITHLLAAVVLLAAAVAPALVGQACNSVGVSPVRIEVLDAQGGESYVRTVSVQNPCAYGRDIAIAAEAEAGTWTTTEPAAGFHLDPQSSRIVQVTIAVPEGTGPGRHDGLVRFTGAATEDNSGNSQVAVGAAVPLEVTVGGTAIVKLTWLSATAADTDSATPPRGTATVRNDGNVAATARMAATVTAAGSQDVLASGSGALELDPGQTADVPVSFTAPLERGEYVMRFDSTEPAGFHAQASFRVTAPGEIAPKGTLLAIQHVPYGTAGAPLRIDGTFRNEGTVAIRSAQLKAEVTQDGILLAALESDALAVPVGATVNLTTYWTPPAAGTFGLRGHVVYDGYQTPDLDSPVNVRAGAAGDNAGLPWWLWLVAAAVVIAALAVWLVARKRKRGKGPPPTTPGDAALARSLRRRP